jgi:alpha-tubulin suppressor-like RCC1 family protein
MKNKNSIKWLTLRVDGSIACWGQDTAGETSPPLGHYVQVEAGGYHACALTSDGTPICWGSNASSQVVGFSTSSKFQQLALGSSHSCGLKEDSTIVCWGRNNEGQSTAIDDETFSSIVAGYRTTCGIKTDGIATCWGKNNRSYGYLTQIDIDVYDNPLSVCGLKTDHTLSCPSMGSVPNDRFT